MQLTPEQTRGLEKLEELSELRKVLEAKIIQFFEAETVNPTLDREIDELTEKEKILWNEIKTFVKTRT